MPTRFISEYIKLTSGAESGAPDANREAVAEALFAGLAKQDPTLAGLRETFREYDKKQHKLMRKADSVALMRNKRKMVDTFETQIEKGEVPRPSSTEEGAAVYIAYTRLNRLRAKAALDAACAVAEHDFFNTHEGTQVKSQIDGINKNPSWEQRVAAKLAEQTGQNFALAESLDPHPGSHLSQLARLNKPSAETGRE